MKEKSEAITLEQLRSVRLAMKGHCATLEEDLRPFLHQHDHISFRRLPDSPSKKDDIGITVTASALMGLATSSTLRSFYDADYEKTVESIFKAICIAPWQSSKLLESNAFTVTLILRAAGILQPFITTPIADMKKTLTTTPKIPKREKTPYSRRFEKQTLASVAAIFQADFPASLAVEKYPTNPAIAYWFVDAIDRLSITLESEQWLEIAKWASTEFTHQASLVGAKHHERMDPIAMSMAACLVQRVRRVCKEKKLPNQGSIEESLPSSKELRYAIRSLFKIQLTSGIWNKYFALFHYPGAGSNYCFAFEMLEAILHEFSAESILEDTIVFDGMRRAAEWCNANRLDYTHEKLVYRGWNSGGQIETLNKGMPESWATAVVHMFLFRLLAALDDLIEKRLLLEYNPVLAKRKWSELIDSEVFFLTENRRVKDVLQQYLLEPIKASVPNTKALRRSAMTCRRSVLLFGPPGTSKTSLVRAFALELGWPCIEIDPSHFLHGGLPQIYSSADKVFQDLGDMAGVVVLFDEMDALVQSRMELATGDGPPHKAGGVLDITGQFLTTSMLPKLAQLHDDGRVVFFMATNFQSRFDQAIKRPGRFDLLVYMGPPSWSDKLRNIKILLKDQIRKAHIDEVSTLLQSKTPGSSVAETLDRFTWGECQAMFSYLNGLGSVPELLTHDFGEFLSVVTDWSTKFIVLRDGVLAMYKKEERGSVLQ